MSPAAPPTVRVIGPPKSPPEATPSGVVSVVSAVSGNQTHDGKVLFVTFAPEGGRLLSAGDDGTVRLWRREGLELALPAAAEGLVQTGGGGVRGLHPRRPPRLLGSADGMVRLWNLNTGAEVRNFALRLGVTSAALSPDGRRLWSAGGGR